MYNDNMSLLNLLNRNPKTLKKESVQIFEKQIPLRIIKGKIMGFDIKTWTRYYDKNGNIQRYGDGVDDRIVREENYQELELYLKTIHYDGYMKPGHHDVKTTLYFERDSLFEGFDIGQTMSYYGLFIKEGSVWTNYFLFNHDTKRYFKMFNVKTIGEKILEKEYNDSDLKKELELSIEQIKIK